MVQAEVNRSGLTALPGVGVFSDVEFRLLNFSYRHELPIRLDRTQGMPKMFIETDDRPALASLTVQLFRQAPEPKQLVRYRVNYPDMTDEERKNYENQIVNFFLRSLPASGHEGR
jgi:hypothetical protein